MKLFVDPHDSLFVLDGGQRWTVYDRDLRLRRSFVGLYGGRINSTVQLARQGILTTATVAIPPADASLAFHLMDFEGNLVRSFGPADGVPNGIDRVERVSALDAQGRIWVAPPNGAATGLMLERWSFDGRRDLTLHRAVEWLPDSGYAAVPHPWEPRLPEYDLLHIDDQGLIWVVVIVRDSRWQLLPASEARQHQTELFDARLEVIDPESGFVLASYRHDGPQDPLPPFARFASGRRSYRLVEDTAGLMSIEIYDIQLVARR